MIAREVRIRLAAAQLVAHAHAPIMAQGMPLLTSFVILSTYESLVAYGRGDTKAGLRSGGVG